MINSRDSANTWNPNKKEQIEVPFSIGSVVEAKTNPSVLAEILEYKVTQSGIKAGLGFATATNKKDERNKDPMSMPQYFAWAEFSGEVDLVISVEELEEKFQETKTSIVANLSKVFENKTESIVPEGDPFFTSGFEVVEEDGKKLVRRKKIKGI